MQTPNFKKHRIYSLVFAALTSGAVSASSFALDVNSYCQQHYYEDDKGKNVSNITIDPVLKWEWTGSDILPEYNQVSSTPMVAPLEDTNQDGLINEDDIPAIIFSSFPRRIDGKVTNVAVLRAVSGQDGHEIWTITDEQYRVKGRNTIAVGDIDNDGHVEILAQHTETGELMAFEHTGEFKWRTTLTGVAGGIDKGYLNPAIIDLDQDGTQEILIGSFVLDNQGILLWTGGLSGVQSAFAADVNLDGQLEVIMGAAVFSHKGQLLWENTQAGMNEAKVAVANFNDDPYPELVIVSKGSPTGTKSSGSKTYDGSVYLFDYEGNEIWQTAIPGGGKGGAPVIANFAGDSKPEIGVAGGKFYSLFSANGKVIWSLETRDASSNQTGSSAFDFDGDGKLEIVYGDEWNLHIYQTSESFDGIELATIPNTSGTIIENPVIADVDNDGQADIVVARNEYSNSLLGREGAGAGIRVYQNVNNDWSRTRNIWNQQAYFVTNVEDGGTIPTKQANSWQPYMINGWSRYNTFRTQPILAPTTTECDDMSVSIAGFIGQFDMQTQSNVLVWDALSAHIGFNIYRAERQNDEYIFITKLNKTLYSNQGMSDEYIFIDDTVVAGKMYYYGLESIDFAGKITQHVEDIIPVTTK